MTAQERKSRPYCKGQKNTSLHPRSLHIRHQIVEHTKTKRKHWDLYRHLGNPVLLFDALNLVKENKGSGGIDGIELEDILGREEEFVRNLALSLREKKYAPKPVRRVYIPKANGKIRPLGVPTLTDRVVQTALVLLLEPIYEQRFLPCSYGFRPLKRAVDCAADVADTAFRHRHVIDADIEAFFDSVAHRKLIGMLKEEIADSRILNLIGEYLRAGFMEVGKPWQRSEKGTPQGGPLSPLLANIYLHHALDQRFAKLRSKSAKLFRYADDFVVAAKTKSEAKLLLQWIGLWLEEVGLKLSKEKTKLVNLKNRYRGYDSKFDFLGFKFHLRAFADNPERFWVARQASEKSRQKLRSNLKEKLPPQLSPDRAKRVVESIWTGWTGYFRFANANRVFYKEIRNVERIVFEYLRKKFRRTRRPVPWRKLIRLGHWIIRDIKPAKVISDLVRQRNQQQSFAAT